MDDCGTANARVHPVHLTNEARVPGSHRPLEKAGWLELQIRLNSYSFCIHDCHAAQTLTLI